MAENKETAVMENSSDGFDDIIMNPVKAREMLNQVESAQKEQIAAEQPETKEGEDEIEEAPKPEEQTQESPEKGDDEKNEKPEEEFNPFKDFNDPEDPDTASPLERIAKTFEVEAKDETTLIEKLQEKLSVRVPSEPQYADDKIREFVEKANTLAKAGEDPWVLRDNRGKVAGLEKDLEKVNGFLSTLDGIYKTERVEDRKNFLKTYYQAEFAPALANQLVEGLETMDDPEIIRISNDALIQERNRAQSRVNALKGEVESIRTSETALLEKAKANAEAARAAITKAIEAYEDPDGVKYYTNKSRRIATQAMNSDMVSFAIPKGLAQVFFLGENGQFDVNKAIENLAALSLGREKRTYIEGLVKKQTFKKDQEFTKETPRPASTTVDGPKDPWSGDIEVQFPNRKNF